MNMVHKLGTEKSNAKRIHFNINQFTELIDTYLSSTHLHGCRYIVDKKYNILAPIYWITLLLLSFTFCVSLIFLQLSRYQDSPVLNVITSTGYPVWKSPFPTVIICNHNVVYKNNSRHIIEILKNNGVNDTDVDDFLNSLSYLIACDDCLEKAAEFDVEKMAHMYNILEALGYDLSKLMKELAHPCSSMLKKCKWQAIQISCNSFKLIKTSLGYCCAFNYFGTKEEQASNEEPFYTGGAGLGSGLSITVNIESSQYISTAKSVPGVTVFAHSIHKYPQVGVQYTSLIAGQIISFALDQSVFQSDSDIVRLTPESRGCLFEHEGRLNWTNIYNSRTCFNECKANYIEKLCNCVPFYYPITGNARVCSFSDIPCLIRYNKRFANLMLSDEMEADIEFMHRNGNEHPDFCYCLPNCNEVNYGLHDEKKRMPPANETSVVNVYYSSVAGILRIRTAILTWDTLLGTIGGTFGLCMGGSVISMLEFLFYFIQVLFGKKFIEKRKKRVIKPPPVKINVQPNHQKIHSLHL